MANDNKMSTSPKLSGFQINLFLLCIFSFIFSVLGGRSNEYVTCGSVLKLMNERYRVRLHSHDVKYGTGSGQQSVTGTEVTEDVNSHWVVKGSAEGDCTRGECVQCGSTIRLEHLATGKNLHSHHFSSPLSGNQEVSAYGEKGVGDTGDNWTVLCGGSCWERDETVRLKHQDTDVYLGVTGRTYGRPIHGQAEVVGVNHDSGSILWQAMEGLFIHRSSFNPRATHTHDAGEL